MTTLYPDVAMLSGKDESGCVNLIQKSIRPNILTPFEMPYNYQDMWTLKDGEDHGRHSLLVLTRKDATMIFKTGKEIVQLENSGMTTSVRTLY